MVSHDVPIPRKKKGVGEKENIRVNILIHPHQRMCALMVLTAETWMNLQMTHKVTPNDSSWNVGKAIWQTEL